MAFADVASTLAYLLGAVALLAAIGHWVAVTLVAFGERSGFDRRLARMIAIGFMPAACGIAMLVGARLAASDASLGFGIVSLSSATMAAILVALWPSLSTGPNGSATGTAIGIAAFALNALVAWFAR